MLLLMIDLPN